MSFPPEVFTWIGISLFLVLSLLTFKYLHGHFSFIPVSYHLLAFEGLAQMFMLNYLFQVEIDLRRIASHYYFTLAVVSVLFTLWAFQKNVGFSQSVSKGTDVYEA